MKKTVAVLAILSLALIGGSAIYGTEKDPVVIVSYLNEKLSQLKNTGGASTASLANRVTIMREHLRAFRNHGIKNNALRLSLRYFSKLWESVPHLVR